MQKLQGHKSKVRVLAFSPDGRKLATVAGREQRVSLWQLPSGERTISPGHADEIQTLTFSPDGESVVIASGRYLRLWNIAAGTITEKWLRAANYCHHVAFSPDGKLLVASSYARYGAGDRCRIDLFRMANLEEKTFKMADYGTPFCLAFSPDGRFLAMGGDYQLVRIWRMRGKGRTVTSKLGVNIHSVAFAPDGELAAIGTAKSLLLYSTSTNKPCGELTGHTGPVRALSFSPDGTLLSAGDDGTARLWDMAKRSEKRCFDWKVGPIRVASFSPDGMLAAVGGDDGLVLWDVE